MRKRSDNGMARCELCGNPADLEEWCNGCGTFICEMCRINPVPKTHAPEEHQEEDLTL